MRNDHESSVSMKTICSHLSPLKNSLKTQFGQFYLFIKFFYGHRSSLLLHLIDFLKFIMAIVMSDFVSLVAKFSIIRFSFWNTTVWNVFRERKHWLQSVFITTSFVGFCMLHSRKLRRNYGTQARAKGSGVLVVGKIWRRCLVFGVEFYEKNNDIGRGRELHKFLHILVFLPGKENVKNHMRIFMMSLGYRISICRWKSDT